MKFKWWLIAAGIALYFVAISCGNGGNGGDAKVDDDSEADPEACGIDETSMVEIPYSFSGSDCGALGLSIVVDHLYANATLDSFKVAGQFSIDNENVYYLRGDGLTDSSSCFDQIAGAGTFEVGVIALDCTDIIAIDVVASTEPDSSAFCGFIVHNDVGCGGDDDVDDDTDDDADDDADDDSAADCEATLGENVEACFEGLDETVVCAQDDADCWVSCFNAASTCEDWADCLVSDCGYTVG